MEGAEHKIDRTRWPRGPWSIEGDRYEWRVHGMPALIVRNRLGALCGYVGVTYGHPWYKKHYDAVDANVHGGLTYSDSCQGGICHVPLPHEDGDVWWLGFDTAHSGDLVPGMLALGLGGSPLFMDDEYRDVDYVRGAITKLAAQAILAKRPLVRLLARAAKVLYFLRYRLSWSSAWYAFASWFRERIAEAEAYRAGEPFDDSTMGRTRRSMARLLAA